MSKSWYTMGKKPVYNNGMEQDDFDMYALDSMSEILEDSPIADKQVTFYNYDFSKHKPTQAIIQNKGNDTTNKFYDRQMLSNIGDSTSYNYVGVYNNKEIYLMISIPISNYWYEKTLLVMCNYRLKWKDEYGNIITRYCTVQDSTKYTTGETEKPYNVILANTRRTIYLPYDKDTLKITEAKRLMIDKGVDTPNIYKVTSVDRVTNTYQYDSESDMGGYISINCLQDQYNNLTDDNNLMIADYTPNPKISIDILNVENEISILPDTDYQLQVQVTLNDKLQNNDSLIYRSDNPKVAIIDGKGLISSKSEGNCVISIEYNGTIKEVLLNCDSNANDTYKLNILSDSDEILFGDTQIFKLELYNNESKVNVFTYSVVLDDEDNAFEVISDDDYTIEIKAKSKSKYIGSKATLLIVSEEYNVDSSIDLKVVGYM